MLIINVKPIRAQKKFDFPGGNATTLCHSRLRTGIALGARLTIGYIGSEPKYDIALANDLYSHNFPKS